MFTGNLRNFPPFFQIAVFLGLWSILSLLGTLLITKIFPLVYGAEILNTLSAANIEAFLLMNGVYSFCTFVLPPILFASLAMHNPMEYLDVNSANIKNIGIALIISLGLLCFVPAIGTYINEFQLGEAATANLEALRKRNLLYFEDRSYNGLIRNLVIIAIIPAIGEELFFRGMIQRFINSWLKKPIVSILLTAVFFSVIHGQVHNFFPILIAGIVLGLVYYWTSNLSLAILIHFLHNGLQVWINWQYNDLNEETISRLSLLLMGAMALGTGIWLLYKNRTPLPAYWSVQEKPKQLESPN